MTYPYVCDTCGKMGTEDDGIEGPGVPCPDADSPDACEGTIRWTEDGYREVLDELRDNLSDALTRADDEIEVTLTVNQLNVTLDALSELDMEITSKNPDRRKPWEEYG